MTALQIILAVQTTCQVVLGSTFCIPTEQPARAYPLYEMIAQPQIDQSIYNYSSYMYR
jgi:hypothetical protein